MTLDNVTQELRAALDKLRGEHSRINGHISAIENLLRDLGAPAKRGPGRPKGSVNKRGPGRPKGSVTKRGPGRPKGSGAKRGPGRPPKSATASAPVSAKASASEAGRKRKSPNWSNEAREAARARMKAYWAQRRKNG